MAAKKQHPRSEVAHHISALVNNPDCPGYIYDALMTFLTNASSDLWDEYMTTAPMIEEMLESGKCGYILCPGPRNGGVCKGPHTHPKGDARRAG